MSKGGLKSGCASRFRDAVAVPPALRRGDVPPATPGSRNRRGVELLGQGTHRAVPLAPDRPHPGSELAGVGIGGFSVLPGQNRTLLLAGLPELHPPTFAAARAAFVRSEISAHSFSARAA
jgi:hypothetical protein